MASSPTPLPSPEKPEEKVSSGLTKLWEGISEFFGELTDLSKGQDKEGTIISIKKNMRMRGANAWLLMCSIMIASLGLDLNSPAVIIGAMLISPLMSPILGIGLAVGINDKNTLSISLQHFGVSIAIALVTSTVYFFFTPIGSMTNEIVNRTAPTFLDASVAFFGGIAGIISGTRKDKSNAIPGVAIATALMPPLCVTGFGFANLIRYGVVNESFQGITHLNNWEIVLNSFYLFFLNAVLVALATYLIVRLLRFPVKAFQNPKERRRTRAIIFGVSLILVIPSITILINVLQNIKSENQIKIALKESFGEGHKYVDGWSKIQTKEGFNLLIKVYGTNLTNEIPAVKAKLEAELPQMSNIEIIPSTEVDLNKINALEAQYSEFDSLLNQIKLAPRLQENKEMKSLQSKIAILESDSLLEKSIETSVLALYPDYISEVAYYNHMVDTINKKYPLLSIRWKGGKVNTKVEDRLVSFIKKQAHRETIMVSYLK